MREQVCLAGTVLAVLLGSSALHAAPVIAGNYYEERVVPSCPQSFYYCRAAFTATPAGRTLMIERVACNSTTTAAIKEWTLNVGLKATGVPTQTYPLAYASPVPFENLRYYSINETVSLRVTAGRVPFVTIEYPHIGSANLECIIVGSLL